MSDVLKRLNFPGTSSKNFSHQIEIVELTFGAFEDMNEYELFLHDDGRNILRFILTLETALPT